MIDDVENVVYQEVEAVFEHKLAEKLAEKDATIEVERAEKDAALAKERAEKEALLAEIAALKTVTDKQKKL
jgi:hypothetical protein